MPNGGGGGRAATNLNRTPDQQNQTSDDRSSCQESMMSYTESLGRPIMVAKDADETSARHLLPA